ncbi:MAG TPA: hypothetical protein VL485_21300 [Ktedonobacteraceae bacterium]|jgi:hypothetical protein|nr:hypothetical protein [Ktedonobacteraceae bacterium]
MDHLIGVFKKHEIGIWCKRAAWIIVAINIINIVYNIYFSIVRGQGSDLVQDGSLNLLSPIAIPTLMIILTTVSATLFPFFILYAAGTLLDHVIADEEEGSDDEDSNDEEGLTAGERTPGQIQ